MRTVNKDCYPEELMDAISADVCAPIRSSIMASHSIAESASWECAGVAGTRTKACVMFVP